MRISKKIVIILLIFPITISGYLIYNKINEIKVSLPIFDNRDTPKNGYIFNYIDPNIKIKFRDEKTKKIYKDRIKLAIEIEDKKVEIPISSKVEKSDSIVIRTPILLPYQYLLIIGDKKYNFDLRFKGSIKDISIDRCRELQGYDKVNCIKQYFLEKSYNDNNSKKTLKELSDLIDKKPDLKDNCHAYIHVIGEITSIISSNFLGDFKNGNITCEYGYYHGLLEGYAMKMDNEKLNQLVVKFCDYYSFGFNKGSCYHSLGHMAWIRTGGNFEKSINICQILPKDERSVLSPQENCISGVAMNWMHAYQDAPENLKKKLTPDIKNPLSICETIKDEKQSSGCYTFAGGIYNQSKSETVKLSSICNTLIEIKQNTCFLNVGFILGFDTSVEFDEALRICSKAEYEDPMWSCFGNLLSNRTILEKEGKFAKRVCDYSREIGRYNAAQCKIMFKEEKLRIDQPEATVHSLH